MVAARKRGLTVSAICYMPKVRGTHSIDNITAINGKLYLAENGSKWRSLPEKYGKWHTIYMKGGAKFS
jgi:transposase